tara:strand:- start:7729 stop:7923 length:195 start_codon:yes stop_codon:yes gene_type:complete
MSDEDWKWNWAHYWLILLSMNGVAFVMSWTLGDYANSILTMGMFIFCALGFLMSSEKDEDEDER